VSVSIVVGPGGGVFALWVRGARVVAVMVLRPCSDWRLPHPAQQEHGAGAVAALPIAALPIGRVL